MKAILQPFYFVGRNEREVREYGQQLEQLKRLYGEDAEFLEEKEFGSEIPKEAQAIIFPQLFGAVFREKERLGKIELPIIILTSEFGTVEMWDWEIVAWLRDELHLNVFSPYKEELARVILRTIAAKAEMRSGMKFLMMQDDPGEGMQAYLFKRFDWWDEDCTKEIEDAFGLKILYRSWKETLADSSDPLVRIARWGIGVLGPETSARILHRFKMLRRWRRHHLSRRKAKE